MTASDADIRLYLFERELSGDMKGLSSGVLPGSYWVMCGLCEAESYLPAEGNIPESILNILVYGYCSRNDRCRDRVENARSAVRREVT